MTTHSEEHLQYLKNVRRSKLIVNLCRIFILIFFLILWELLARFHVINTFLWSSPTSILKTMYSLTMDGTLFTHIWYTLYEIFISFTLSFIISFIVATTMYYVPMFSKIIDPYLTVLNSLPKVALGPLIIIWAGSGSKSIILMGLLISVFVTTINIYNYFSNIDEKYLLLMKSFSSSKKDIFTKVIIPSNYSNLISCLKINVSMNYIGVVMGELLVSKMGLGYLIMYGSSVFHIDLVITSVFILCVLSYFMYFLIEFLEKKLIKKENQL